MQFTHSRHKGFNGADMEQVILKAKRTEHAKIIRRMYGDNSGMCRFADKVWYLSADGCSNTISTVWKDNLLFEYER